MNDFLNEQGQQAAADVSLDATLDTMLAEMDAEDTAAAAEEVPAGPNPFEALGLAPELVRAVTDMGYTQPTPVQAQAIPLAMGEGADACFERLLRWFRLVSNGYHSWH